MKGPGDKLLQCTMLFLNFILSTHSCGSADALEDLARDLSSTNTADKERAVSMLSSLTLYLEYHSAMMKAGVFPALIKAILDARMVPQVRLPED